MTDSIYSIYNISSVFSNLKTNKRRARLLGTLGYSLSNPEIPGLEKVNPEIAKYVWDCKP